MRIHGTITLFLAAVALRCIAAEAPERSPRYNWWSLQPVKRSEPAKVNDLSWPRNPIDCFVLSRLEAKGLRPAGEADRRTLIRRLYFDLIGLPPEPEVVERFINDPSPAAYELLVEQLLGSPHYGERWARRWLDVVRFGESQGFERNLIRENAWRYRDWVIQSFNDNTPFDEFVRRQIAGDVLYPGDLDALIATGYHVCGTWDQVAHLEGSAMMRQAARQDDLEDLVATLGQAFLGLTINCARCHHHKFDPIPQREYYQIAALLGGVTQAAKERENISASRDRPREAEIRKEIDELAKQLAQLEAEVRGQLQPTSGKRPIEGLQVLYVFGEKPGNTIGDQSQAGEAIPLTRGKPARFSTAGPPGRLIQSVKHRGELTIEAWVTPGKDQQGGPARIVTLSKDTSLRNFTLGQDGDRFDVRLRTTKTDPNGLPSLTAPNGSITTKKTHVVYTFDRDGTGRLYVNGRPVAQRKIGGDFTNWDDNFHLGLGDELVGGRIWEGAFHLVAVYSRALAEDEVRRNFDTESRDIRAGDPFAKLLDRATDHQRSRHRELLDRRGRLKEELNRISLSGPAHVVIPQQPPVFHVLERGDFRKPKGAVAPAGLQSLSRAGLAADFGLKPDSPEAQRRIKLAEWLTDRRNPLLARVFVNRLWHYHFGQGIVDTPSDFGFNGGRPSHPELLDWLASELMEPTWNPSAAKIPSRSEPLKPWNIKHIHRLIVTSAAYRQQSNIKNPQAEMVDGTNRLLWRANRSRLEGEAVRDAVLAVSGALNRRLGGSSYRDVKVSKGVMGTNAEFTDPTGEFSAEVNRRTIYRLWARSGSLPMLESFDCPDPSVMSPRRTQTITPVQAFSLLNSSFMHQCAERFAERVRREAGTRIDHQIGRAYALAFARSPRPQELAVARGFVQKRGLTQLCLVLFNTNEFLFVD